MYSMIVDFFQVLPPKTNMTMQKQPFEDVFFVNPDDFPVSHLSFFSGSIHVC